MCAQMQHFLHVLCQSLDILNVRQIINTHQRHSIWPGLNVELNVIFLQCLWRKYISYG